MLEMKYHKDNYFITLTYDDKHIPWNDFVSEETGEIGHIQTLRKRDWQLFMKSLRKEYDKKYPGEKLRFFMSGEYGDTTHRPHYHAIIFGLKLDDLKFYKNERLGNGELTTYYNSDFLSGLWKHGFIVVARACWETCSYVARYVMKKQKGQDSQIYSDYNFEPEFTLMSRRPGIGRQYYEDNKDIIWQKDFTSVGSYNGSKRIYPSRYFKNIYKSEDVQSFEDWKEKRIDALESLKVIRSEQTSLPYLDSLKVEESAKLRRLQALKRQAVDHARQSLDKRNIERMVDDYAETCKTR